MERILGKLEGKQPGPLIICLAAVHGNEPLGYMPFKTYIALPNPDNKNLWKKNTIRKIKTTVSNVIPNIV